MEIINYEIIYKPDNHHTRRRRTLQGDIKDDKQAILLATEFVKRNKSTLCSVEKEVIVRETILRNDY